jgi:c(7)-type cytochrome triheme protein
MSSNNLKRTGSLCLVLKSVCIAALFSISMNAGSAEPGDFVFKRPLDFRKGFSPAHFPHWIHRIRYRCYVCHNDIFKMKRGDNRITMEKITDGQFCGTCHNGKIAFKVNFGVCANCHKKP